MIRNFNLNSSNLQLQQKSSPPLDRVGELEDMSFSTYIESILDHLTQTVYQVVSWALFAEHQLIFSFSVCINILKHPGSGGDEQKIATKENSFFLISTLLADMQQNVLSERIKSLGDFNVFVELSIDEKSLRQLVLLEEMLPLKFGGLCANMKVNHDKLWAELVSCKDPYKFMSSNG